MGKAVEKYMKKQMQILSAAKSLFLSAGYQNTGMDRVAADAGVTKQTVYRYFPSKLELFREVLESMSPKGRGYEFGTGDVKSELEKFAAEFLKLHLTDERIGLYRLIVAESHMAQELGSVFYEAAQSGRRKSLSIYLGEKFITDNPELDAEIFTSMLLVPRALR